MGKNPLSWYIEGLKKEEEKKDPAYDPNNKYAKGKKCPDCNGTGKYSSGSTTCSVCNGSGGSTCSKCGGGGYTYVTSSDGKRTSQYCSACGGKGKKHCYTCGGSGKKSQVQSSCERCAGKGINK